MLLSFKFLFSFSNFNSGVYDQTATVNGLQFQTSGGNLEFGTFSLYGIKEYS